MLKYLDISVTILTKLKVEIHIKPPQKVSTFASVKIIKYFPTLKLRWNAYVFTPELTSN